MKAVNFTLVVLFALLVTNIAAPYIITNGIEAGLLFVMLAMVNRFVQPLAVAMCVYALFRKQSIGFIIFYAVYIVTALLFFLELIAWYKGMESIGPGMEEH